jgi:hypothetical protein
MRFLKEGVRPVGRAFAGRRRAYALAAHTVASVTKLRARARVLVASLAILAAIAIPGIANASAAAAAIVPNVGHSGTFTITTPFTFTQSNARFNTHSTVSGCVNATSGVGTFGWHFRLIWYNGGANTVLWTSREFTGTGTNHCSPTITTPKKDVSVYSQETLDCNNPLPLPCTIDGNWRLVTN